MNPSHDPVFENPHLASDLIDSFGGFYLPKICDLLGVDKVTFAQMTGRKIESVARLFVGQSFKPRASQTRQVLKELVQILCLLRTWGIEQSARNWMNAPMPSFDGNTPVELVADGRGQELISQLLSMTRKNPTDDICTGDHCSHRSMPVR